MIRYVGASFCCQCKTFRPKVEEFCKKNNVEFVYVDAEEDAEFVANNGVRNIPMVFLYDNDELVLKGTISSWEEIVSYVKSDR